MHIKCSLENSTLRVALLTQHNKSNGLELAVADRNHRRCLSEEESVSDDGRPMDDKSLSCMVKQTSVSSPQALVTSVTVESQ